MARKLQRDCGRHYRPQARNVVIEGAVGFNGRKINYTSPRVDRQLEQFLRGLDVSYDPLNQVYTVGGIRNA